MDKPGPIPSRPSQTQHRAALLDLAERARGGIVFHLLLWLLLGWMSGIVRTAPGFFWCQAALFGGVMVLRTAFERPLARRAVDNARARWGFLLLLLWNPLQWGLLCGWAALWPPLQVAHVHILVVLVGLAAAGGMGLAINPLVRLAYPMLAVVPAVVPLMLAPSRVNIYVTGAAIVFILYIARASKVVQADYWAAAHARIELEERARQLERLSITDALTQVHNRQFLDRQLGVEWARAERNAHALSLLMIDIDHFKRINDNHGHPFGDACLQAVARALQGALNRPGDLVARYGGEEFAVLLPGIDVTGASAVAARLHHAVAALELAHAGQAVPLTCSIGVHSVADIAHCSVAEAISLADQALYAAKRQGRNRVVLSSSTH